MHEGNTIYKVLLNARKTEVLTCAPDIYKPVRMLQFGIPGESENLFPYIYTLNK